MGLVGGPMKIELCLNRLKQFFRDNRLMIPLIGLALMGYEASVNGVLQDLIKGTPGEDRASLGLAFISYMKLRANALFFEMGL